MRNPFVSIAISYHTRRKYSSQPFRYIHFSLFVCALMIGSFNLSLGQALNGKVHDGLSEQGLKGVSLKIRGFTETASDDFGLFEIGLPGKSRGELIKLNILKSQYIVINREAMEPSIPDTDDREIHIYMCPAPLRDSLAGLFYGIQIEKLISIKVETDEKKLAEEINTRGLEALKENERRALSQRDSMAARLARFDPRNSSRELTRAMQYYQQGEVEKALELLDADTLSKRIEDRKRAILEMEEANKRDTEALLRAADMSISNLQFEKTQTYYQKAAEADPTNFKNMLSLCLFLFEQGRSDLLLTYAKKLLRASENLEERSIALNYIGQAATSQTKYAEAVEAYEEAISIKREIASRQNTSQAQAEVARTLNNLGNVYWAQQQYTRADTVFQKAMETYKSLAQEEIQPFQADMASTLNNLGITYYDLKQPQKATEYYEESLTLYRGLADNTSLTYESEIATTLNNLGLAYSELTLNDKALETYEEVLVLYKKLSTQNLQRYEANVAATLKNKANIYKELDSLSMAISAYEEALGSYRKLVKQNPERFQVNLAKTLNNLANTYSSKEMYPKAIDAYKESMEIYQQLIKQNPGLYGLEATNTAENLAITLKNQNRYVEAAEVYQQVLEMHQNLTAIDFVKYSIKVGHTFDDLGTVYRTLIKLPEAVAYFRKADSTYNMFRGSQEVSARQQRVQKLAVQLSRPDAQGTEFSRKAWLLKNSQQLDSTSIYLLKAKEAFDALPETSLDIASFKTLALLYERLSSLEKDPKVQYTYYHEEAYYRQKLADTAPEEPNLLKQLASTYYSLSWYALFAEKYSEAEQAARKSLELSSDNTSVITNLTSSLLFQGKYEEVKPMYEEWKDKPWEDNRFTTYGEAFLADLHDLEKAGITHPDVEKIKSILSEE